VVRKTTAAFDQQLVDVLLKDGKCDPQNRSWAAVIGAAANGYAEVVTQLLQFIWNNQVRVPFLGQPTNKTAQDSF
jgi:hypothetical protein